MSVKYDDSMMVSLNIFREHGLIIGYDMNRMSDEKLFVHIKAEAPNKAAVLLEISEQIRKLNIL